MRTLILAPHGQDAAVATDILHAVGIGAEACPNLPTLVQELERGAGFALITDEAFRTADLTDLSRWLADQPALVRLCLHAADPSAGAGTSATLPWRVSPTSLAT